MRDISKSYGRQAALRDVRLAVEPGERLGVLGPSAAGKTTLLRLIAGLDAPDAGGVLFDGAPAPREPRDRRVAMIAQRDSLWGHMTLRRQCRFVVQPERLARAERDRRIDQTLDALGLLGRADAHPHELSAGQAQRGLIARLLVQHRPAIWLLDEPLSNLDVELTDSIRRLLLDEQARRGVTCLWVTHESQDAWQAGGRIAAVQDGRIHQVGRAGELYDRPASTFVARLLGQTDLIGVDRLDGDVAAAPWGPQPIASAEPLTPPAVLVSRPSAWTVARDGPVEAAVSGCRYVGDGYRLTVAGAATSDIQWHIQAREPVETGRSLRLRPPERMWAVRGTA